MEKAIQTLQNSGVILTPTETTFGLSCLSSDIKAIEKVNRIKNRPINKNFILLVDNEARLQRYVEVPDLAWDIIDLSEKPVSIVYDKILDLPQHLISPEGTVAIRLTTDKGLKKIIGKLREPIVSTSANFAGEKTPSSFQDISPQILEQVDYILPEAKTFVPIHKGSSIIQLGVEGEVKVIRE